MKSRRSVVVVEGFYRDPLAVRQYAKTLRYYVPYESDLELRAGQPVSWWASEFRVASSCPFKSSDRLIAALERAVGEPIDRNHWNASFPVDESLRPVPLPLGTAATCLWNCCFHLKPPNRQTLGGGVHNHVRDGWNSVGPEGWAGLVYLDPHAPLNGGLHLWRNVSASGRWDWMTPPENWEHIDEFGNVFNRLVLVRGDIPHSGADGWGSTLDDGRVFQTFFFRTVPSPERYGIVIEGLS